MKVAFDVQGTLDGHETPQVVRLFRAFAELGCEMHVWSFGGRMMARDAIDDHLLAHYGKVDPKSGLRRVHAMSKRSKEYGERREDAYMDLCVDDDHSTAETLDAKRVLYVYDIPTDESEIVALAKRLYDEASRDQART